MRAFIAGLMLAFAASFSAVPAQAQEASVPTASGEARLTRYVYTVTWEGAKGLLPAKGQVDMLFQDDLKADQQHVFAVGPQGGGLIGHVILAEGMGFLSQPGKNQEVMQDFALGMGLVGEFVTVKNLIDWAQGRDSASNVELATIQSTADGYAQRLSEAGWHVVYGDEWMTSAGVATEVPMLWTLTHDGSDLKVTFELREARVFDDAHLPSDYKPVNVM